jgi:hypothetical protein
MRQTKSGAALKTICETKSSDITLRLVQTANAFVGLAIKGQEIKAREDGADADDVWRRIHDAAARLNPLFIGYSSARARFLHFFPEGFAGAAYLGGERDYKLKAKETLDKAAPLVAVETDAQFGEGVLSAFNKTNLLSLFELVRVRDLLHGPDADAFVRLCAAFTLGERKTALAGLRKLLQPHDCAKWTVVTYLPFLWKPEEHFFLKPTMISTFADRVGHRFAQVYRPELDVEVYEALLDLAADTRTQIADMGPRDMIDVQSFMWTVVEYKEEDKVATS